MEYRSEKVHIEGFQLELLPQKAIYIASAGILIASDLHLGKADHFRRHGIPAPDSPDINTLSAIEGLMTKYKPDKVVFLGDLFHSSYNAAWDAFEALCKRTPGIAKVLIAGNHDILPESYFHKAGLEVLPSMQVGNVLFTHQAEPTELYNIHGHVHPAVRLKGAGRSSMCLPCFIFGRDKGIVPAFGAFTGAAVLKPGKDDKVFVIAAQKVIRV